MLSLLGHIGLGGIIGAAGAVASGLILVGLRSFITREERVRQLEKIRNIGVTGVVRQALFEVQNPELDLQRPRRRATF